MTLAQKALHALRSLHWNFFRIHLACFVFVPLVFSGIVYAGNAGATGLAEGSTSTGIQRSEYVDCLFLCYSAMTTTGLVPINLSALHPFQQACLIFLAIIGDTSFVALLMVLVRKRFFRVHCQTMLANDKLHRAETLAASKMGVEQHAVDRDKITGPINAQLLDHYIPDRVLAESPTISQNTQREAIIGQNSFHRRQTIRARTLGLNTVGLGDRHETRYTIPAPVKPAHTGLGGFPLLSKLGHLLVDTLRLPVRLEHPHTLLTRETTHESKDWSSSVKEHVVSWLPDGFGGLVIGRNSRFFTEELEDERLEQIGGVEYRALRFLSYFVGAILPFAVLSIYFSRINYWSSAFQASDAVQTTTVNPVWSSFYFSVAAYTGAGLSLVDQSIAPFANCYLLIWVLNFAMLLGNHAFPMTLRMLIWLGTKLTRDSTLHQTLHFLLDHPRRYVLLGAKADRRCFLYLFPSHQTWYLLLALIAFIAIELFSFLVLNIGLPVLDSITSGWQRFSEGVLQSLSVRASGFGIVAVPGLAPSTLFLYVILMYIAIYPIALSVRSTNVYEEQALGVYNAEHDTSETTEPAPDDKRPEAKTEIFSKYVMWHVRRQLAFDIWPLALAVFLIACFERSKIVDADTGSWFTLFRIIFECTSAYSMIGLSMGTPNNNYSFCGEFSVPSKIVLMLIMIRGRHRGLPVAIDRAVMLPKAFVR